MCKQNHYASSDTLIITEEQPQRGKVGAEAAGTDTEAVGPGYAEAEISEIVIGYDPNAEPILLPLDAPERLRCLYRPDAKPLLSAKPTIPTEYEHEHPTGAAKVSPTSHQQSFQEATGDPKNMDGDPELPGT